MGLSIEEIIKSFDYIKHVGNGESTYEHCREEIALNEAVAIMRKYQKIQEIMGELNGDFYGSYLKDRQVLEKMWNIMISQKMVQD